ncbi:MAG TPA: hypothetical protein VH796_09090 [Nitrososphaeraceae archaeon]
MHLYNIGLLAGILSTAAMTMTEIPTWRRWGIRGVFEWHENYIITKRLRSYLHLSNTKGMTVEDHFKGILFFHFLNGSIAAVAFPYLILLLIPFFYLTILSCSLFGIFYGILLWIFTLVPIHKPITGFKPWNHPLGHLPAVASLTGHLVYGLVLGILVFLLSTIM